MTESNSTYMQDVYEQGYDDYFNHRDSCNPYDEDTETDFHEAWEAGWFDAQFEEEQEIFNEDEA